MESEKTALKRSFFREYFFYKLRGTLGIAITSAVLGFISCVLSGIIALTMLKTIEKDLNDNSGILSVPNEGFIFSLMMLGLAGMTVLALIAPIVTFKYYRSRSLMDTIGCLPITYGQRFWGDYLSGLAAVVVPFSVMAAIGGIILAAAQPIIDKWKVIRENLSSLDCADKSILLFGVRMFFVMLIVIVAAYSVTTLVVSCCGKAGSMGLYSVIALPIVPAIIQLYGTFVLDLAHGIISEQEINTVLSGFPPVGTFIYLMLDMMKFSFYWGGDSKFTVIPNAAAVIVPLFFIAVSLAAAYFIGKKRKTERVGNSFVVNAMYHILTLMMVLAVIGVYFSANRILGIDFTRILIGAVIAFVFYLTLELVQFRKIRAIWKSMIRYVCVAVVGFGFLIIAMETHGLGIGTHLPKQSSIEEITIKSRDYGGTYGSLGEIKYRAEDAISAILAENQRLIDNYDKTVNGSSTTSDKAIDIIYKLKNGKTVSRCYRVTDESLLEGVVEELKKQPAYEVKQLGVLNREDLTGIKITFSRFDNGTTAYDAAVYIKDSKIPELAERLKYDLINCERSKSDYFGVLQAELTSEEENEWINEYERLNQTRLVIDKTFTRTIEFLNNPDNFVGQMPNDPVTSTDEVKTYYVSYNYMTSDNESIPTVTHASVKLRSDSDSRYAKELMSYFVGGSAGLSNVSFSAEEIKAQTGEYLGKSFHIPEENHEAALKAMMNLIAEQTEALQ